MGIAMTLILLFCFAGSAWFTDQEDQETAAGDRSNQLKAFGPVFADACRQLVASNDLAGLRQLTINSATRLGVRDFSVSIGEGRLLADANPASVNLRQLPERWTLGASDQVPAQNNQTTRLRFPFTVPGRGSGFVDLAQSPVRSSNYSKFSSAALVCSAGLCLLIFVYRRSRQSLAVMDVVFGSLQEFARGEQSITALEVDKTLGTVAGAWNKLLGEVETLRSRTKASPSTVGAENRRAGGNNLEAACDAMSQGLILVDEKMHVRFSNGAACSFLKHDKSSLAGIAAADLVKDPQFHDAIMAIAAGKSRRPVTVEVEQPGDAGAGVLRFCIRPVRRGDADSAMIIIEDITQQRTAERARNNFINQVTHELRTPLTNIRLYTETAIDDGESNPEVRANCLNIINQESRRLERIVTEMLSVAEIEAGSSTVHRDEVYFDVLVKELHADYLAQAQDKQITLEFNVSPKLPKLEADKDKLAIAMHNLIGNALKYTPEGGKVTVSVDFRDGQLAIDVADTGIGIKPEETDRIFDRFFRSDDPRVGKIVGTGLGLTLAREVMRLHGGDVTVQSVLNRGSTFTATMPVLNVAA